MPPSCLGFSILEVLIMLSLRHASGYEAALFETVNKGNEKGRKSAQSGRLSPVT
jgi:hypothetical protein